MYSAAPMVAFASSGGRTCSGINFHPYVRTAWARMPGVVARHENLPDWLAGLSDRAYAWTVSTKFFQTGSPEAYKIVHSRAEESLHWRSEVKGYCLRCKGADASR